jgi:hypothetical protein
VPEDVHTFNIRDAERPIGGADSDGQDLGFDHEAKHTTLLIGQLDPRSVDGDHPAVRVPEWVIQGDRQFVIDVVETVRNALSEGVF